MSDHDEEEGKKRKRAGINTKAYKVFLGNVWWYPCRCLLLYLCLQEPAKPNKKDEKSAAIKKKVTKVVKRKTRAKFTVLDSGRKSIRMSTAIKTQATKIRLKEMDDARKKKKKVVRVEEYMPTQEELLEEAKITEEENLKSLGK